MGAGGDARSSLAARAGAAAGLVRSGAAIPAATPRLRFARIDQALGALDELIAEARAAEDRGLLVQLRSDRALALRYRERWHDALVQIAELRGENATIRPYLREAEADCLLALRRPGEARAIYSELAVADPANRNARIGRFYAEVETEDFDSAFATADTLGDPVLGAQARWFAGLEAQAWERISPLKEKPEVPAYVLSAAAGIEASRGWPRRAHADLAAAAGLAPDDIGIDVALAESHLRRRDLPAARAAEARLAAEFPQQAGVARLTAELHAFDSPAWQFDVRGRRESGGAAAAPGPGVEATGRVYSSPMRDAFRVFAGAGYAAASPPEGDALHTRAGAGLEWRGADAAVEASLWSNHGDVSRAGAAASASWSPGDLWTFSADYERYAWETPLRAVLHGITADGGGIAAAIAWNESRAAALGCRAHDFSDGNRRRHCRFAWAERVIDEPAWSLTLRPAVYGSRNSLGAAAPYFNPSSDLELSLAADLQHRLWRRYEESFGHRVIARAGRYRQAGFADGWIGGVTYEQAWQGKKAELRWGIDVGRARYDGANESYAILFLSGWGRF